MLLLLRDCPGWVRYRLNLARPLPPWTATRSAYVCIPSAGNRLISAYVTEFTAYIPPPTPPFVSAEHCTSVIFTSFADCSIDADHSVNSHEFTIDARASPARPASVQLPQWRLRPQTESEMTFRVASRRAWPGLPVWSAGSGLVCSGRWRRHPMARESGEQQQQLSADRTSSASAAAPRAVVALHCVMCG